MTHRLRLLTRIALFSALIYVFCWATSYFPNVSLIFFIIFSAGFLWGAPAGMTVGAVGMGLWTMFNPYGPAGLPVSIAQMAGAAAAGVVGAIFAASNWQTFSRFVLTVHLMLAAALCTLTYYIPVNTVDAWLFRPFWPRFIAGALWALLSLGFNLVVFPLLFNVTRVLYDKEHSR